MVINNTALLRWSSIIRPSIDGHWKYGLVTMVTENTASLQLVTENTASLLWPPKIWPRYYGHRKYGLVTMVTNNTASLLCMVTKNTASLRTLCYHRVVIQPARQIPTGRGGVLGWRKAAARCHFAGAAAPSHGRPGRTGGDRRKSPPPSPRFSRSAG